MTPDFSVGIGGASVTRPGVYTTSNDRAMVPPRGNPQRRMLVIDVARGGTVGGITTVRNASEVLTQLVGGSGAQLAMKGVNRGNVVDFIRVNKATPATLNLGDVTLTAVGYGLQGRSLMARRTASTARPDAVDVYLKDSRTGRTEPYLNLGPVLDIRYAGTGTAPTVTATLTSGVMTLAFSVTGGVAADAVTFTSDSLSSVQALNDAINATGAWNSRVVGHGSGIDAELTEIKPAAYSAVNGVNTLKLGGTAYERALAESALATATAVPAGTATAATEYTFFTGGTEGAAPTVSDWADALAVAEKSTAYGIVLGTGDEAVIALAVGHAERMSGVKQRRERTIYAGPSLQGTKTALKTAANSLSNTLGSERLIVLADQGKDYDVVTGKKVRVSAAVFAADACATYIAGPVEQNITNVRCAIPEREFEWDEGEIESFLSNGIIPVTVDPDDGLARFEQGLTTYTQDANVMRRKISGLGIKDYLQQKIRVRLKRFVGNVGDETTVTEIVGAVADVLNEESRGANKQSGVLVAGFNPRTGQNEPAWKNIVAVMDGFDLVAVTYEAHPVGEVAYIHADATFTPVRIQAAG